MTPNQVMDVIGQMIVCERAYHAQQTGENVDPEPPRKALLQIVDDLISKTQADRVTALRDDDILETLKEAGRTASSYNDMICKAFRLCLSRVQPNCNSEETAIPVQRESLREAARDFDCSPLSDDSVEVLFEQYGSGLTKMVGRGFIQAVARLALWQQAHAGDPLQGAADHIIECVVDPTPGDIGGRLFIGYNRAERLYNAAIAKKGLTK